MKKQNKHYYIDKFFKDNNKSAGEYPYYLRYDKDEPRNKRWKKQRKKYGFDDRETWSLDYAFIVWVYERFNMYKDIGGQIVNLDYHKFTIDDKEYTQRELIDRIISDCEYLMKSDIWDAAVYDKKYEDLMKCFSAVLPAMWW